MTLVHRRLKWNIVITLCLSSVRRPLLTFHIFNFSYETAELNSTNLDRKQKLNILYQVCVFQAGRKKRWSPVPLIGWDIFLLLLWNHLAKFNETSLYQVCVFQAGRKNNMTTLASDWLRNFQLLLWNRWTEFNKTRQEARSQHPLQSLCFSGWSEKQDGCPGLLLAGTFSTSPLKRLNGIQGNLTECKISFSSTRFAFRAYWKNKMAALASDWLRQF